MVKRWWFVGVIAVVIGVGGCGRTVTPTVPPPVGCPDSMLSTTTMPTEVFRPDYVDMVALPSDWDEDALMPTGGSFRDYHAPQVLSIELAKDNVDPEARIMAIAEEHNGVVIGLGSVPTVPVYSVRFCGYGLADLIELGSVIAAAPDVVDAGPFVRLWERPLLLD
ncbi:MAG: hypothetical protein GY926_16865 [bacterium]|nr:hypothetical protein [bacterium]MCP4966887.1 hypothetical protein [bacterium]